MWPTISLAEEMETELGKSPILRRALSADKQEEQPPGLIWKSSGSVKMDLNKHACCREWPIITAIDSHGTRLMLNKIPPMFEVKPPAGFLLFVGFLLFLTTVMGIWILLLASGG